MTRAEIQDLKPGDIVTVTYCNNITTAEVVEVEPTDRYGPQLGWVKTRHISDTCYGTDYAGMEVEAAAEFIVREGSAPAPSPFEMMAKSLGLR